MTKISQLGSNDRALYLALNDPNASEDILFARDVTNKMVINPTQRIMLIGLGGCGIRVVNRVKEIVTAKFQNYRGQIAFLAIDTDADDLKEQKSLQPLTEVYQIPHCDAHKYIDPDKRSPFTNSWIHPRFSLNFNTNIQGAGQNRQAMRCMLYDDTNATDHVDKQITRRIQQSIHTLANGFNNNMRLEIMIVLGVAGGTGSGGLIDIAQFTKAAVRDENFAGRYSISGFFFTKDVVEYKTLGQPADAAKARNCYAALKELDYYMSVQQREAFRKDILLFSSSDKAPIVTDKTHGLYDSAYLINGSGGPEAFAQAIGAVSEGIVNMIANAQSENAQAVMNNAGATQQQRDETQLISSFRSNQDTARTEKLTTGLYDALKDEIHGAFGEDVFNYNAIGVGTASVPEQAFKTYAINIMAQTVAGTGVPGFAPASAVRGWPTEPLTQIEGETKINEMLTMTPESLQGGILAEVNRINWPAGFVNLSVDEIRAGQTQRAAVALGCVFDGPNQIKAANEQAVMDWINSHVEEQYNSFLNTARTFLLQYGPRAFVNLYYGIAPQANRYAGILAKLNAWSNLSAQDFGRISIQPKEAAKNSAQNRVNNVLTGRLAVNVTGFNNAFLEYKRMETACKVRDHLLQGLYWTAYLEKIKVFAEAVSEFAFVLEQLLNAYSGFSAQVSDFNAFSKEANKDAINVNILAQQGDYDWAIQETNNFVAQIQYDNVRADLIDSFLNNPRAWTDDEGGESPRRLFDGVMAKHLNAQVGANMIRLEDKLSIVSYLEMKLGGNNANGGLQASVDQLITNLVLKASVRFNKDPELAICGENSKKCLMIPGGLVGGQANGAAILTAIRTAATAQNLDIFPSTVNDKLVCFRVETGLPIYAMQALPQWESAYAAADGNITMHSNMSKQDMYGKPSIYDPEEGLAWVDYPEITKPVGYRDPRQMDNTGKISREGQFLLDKLDPLFERALKQHIIEREYTPQGYTYWYYDLTMQGWNYDFDLRFCPRDDEGYYAKGSELFDMIAQNNQRSLLEMKHQVMIDNPKFNDATTDELRAIDRAKRALRKNVPMFIAVKRSVEKAESMFAEIDVANEKLRQDRIQNYIPQFIALGLLEHDKLQQWSISMRYPGKTKGAKIAMMLPALMENRNNPLFKEGMTYYVLAAKFIEVMKNDSQMISICENEWNNLQNAAIASLDVRGLKTALAKLDELKPEADVVVSKYDGASNMLNANDVRARLGMDIMQFQFVMDCYHVLLQTYDSIAETINSIVAASTTN